MNFENDLKLPEAVISLPELGEFKNKHKIHLYVTHFLSLFPNNRKNISFYNNNNYNSNGTWTKTLTYFCFSPMELFSIVINDHNLYDFDGPEERVEVVHMILVITLYNTSPKHCGKGRVAIRLSKLSPDNSFGHLYSFPNHGGNNRFTIPKRIDVYLLCNVCDADLPILQIYTRFRLKL